MDQCSRHAERKAVGACLSCGRYLCEECAAQKKGGKLLCFDCAVKVTLDDFEDKEKRDSINAAARKKDAVRVAKKDARRGPRPFVLFIVIGTVIIFLQSGVILADYLMRNRGETSIISSNLIQTRYERDLCANNLHRLSMLVEEYKKSHDNSLPSNLDTLVTEANDPVPACPSSGSRYIYTVDGTSYTITCPSPGDHDLVFLSSRDGTITWQKVGE